MATKVDVFKDFKPVEEKEFDGLLRTINTRYGQLMETVSLACMNAVYYSLVAGRPEFANRLVESVPKYLKQGVLDYLTKTGKLTIQGTGRKAAIIYANRDMVKVGDKEIPIPKQEEGKEKAVEYLQQIGRPTFQRNPAKRKPIISLDWNEEFGSVMDRFKARKKALEDNKATGQEVKEEHEELYETMLHAFQTYQREKLGIGVAVEPAEEIDWEARAKELEQAMLQQREELEKAQEQLASKGRKTVKGEQGREGLKAA